MIVKINAQNNERAAFNELLSECIRTQISKGGCRFVDIVRACRGAYPSVVKDCLLQLETEVREVQFPTYSLSPGVLGKNDTTPLDIIEGNPVLCSWYFTKSACQRIARLRDWSNARLAFLGTPRLYEWFRSAELGKERLLLDADIVVVKLLKDWGASDKDTVSHYDVAKNLSPVYEGKFDCVFFDPPWYPEDYFLWLSRASSLSPKGSIFFALFPELTRPGAIIERRLILKQLEPAASDIILMSSFVDYDMPTFEREQLKANGIEIVEPWKVADFVLADMSDTVRIQSVAGRRQIASWIEIDLGPMRIFVDSGSHEVPPDLPLLSAINGSAFLSSPSSRNPARFKANVLTSRGHGLVSPHPLELLNILHRLNSLRSKGKSVDEEVERLELDFESKVLLADITKGA